MNQRTPNRTFHATDGDAGRRVDRFLAEKLGVSRSEVQKLIKAGRVTVAGRPVKAGLRLAPGDAVTAPLPETEALHLEPEDLVLDVLWEDRSVAAVNKPPGMAVHPSGVERTGTLVNGLLARFGSLFRPDDDPERAGIVHRLDRDTSGVILVALTRQAGESLQEQFRKRRVEKEYTAVVRGVVEFDEGEVNLPLGRDPKRFDRRSVDREAGKEALTLYRVAERFERATLLRVFPRTGRTHQIRVHMDALGHPVVGDKLYGRGKGGADPEGVLRQALHAGSISFRHPDDGERVTVAAPLPGDIAALVQRLRSGE